MCHMSSSIILLALSHHSHLHTHAQPIGPCPLILTFICTHLLTHPPTLTFDALPHTLSPTDPCLGSLSHILSHSLTPMHLHPPCPSLTFTHAPTCYGNACATVCQWWWHMYNCMQATQTPSCAHMQPMILLHAQLHVNNGDDNDNTYATAHQQWQQWCICNTCALCMPNSSSTCATMQLTSPMACLMYAPPPSQLLTSPTAHLTMLPLSYLPSVSPMAHLMHHTSPSCLPQPSTSPMACLMCCLPPLCPVDASAMMTTRASQTTH